MKIRLKVILPPPTKFMHLILFWEVHFNSAFLFRNDLIIFTLNLSSYLNNIPLMAYHFHSNSIFNPFLNSLKCGTSTPLMFHSTKLLKPVPPKTMHEFGGWLEFKKIDR